MVTPELIQYIKSQLSAGLTKDAVKATLMQHNWPSADIESAFQTIPLNHVSKAKTSPLGVVIALVTCLVIGGVGIGVFGYLTKNKTSARNVVASVSPTTAVVPTVGQTKPEERILYSSPEQGYGFQYLKSWKIDQQGTLTVLVDPNSSNAKQCAATLEKILACDMMVSSMPYQTAGTTKTHDEQIKDMASQMAEGNVTTEVTINNLNGYEATITSSEGSSYNILLQGSKNILLAQFPHRKSRADLNPQELAVLNSIVEE